MDGTLINIYQYITLCNNYGCRHVVFDQTSSEFQGFFAGKAAYI